MSTTELKAFCNSVIEEKDAFELPSHDSFFSLIDESVELYENEPDFYRPLNTAGDPGGLLDFTGEDPVPLVVVPDLHARPDFFNNILHFELPKNFTRTDDQFTVFDALDKKLIHLVCVGDALHSEFRGFIRWKEAYIEYQNNMYTGPNMIDEMKEGFELISYILRSKCRWPYLFHFLKGNHENIQNIEDGGDHPFCKFADEGEMVRKFVSEWYGDDILYIYRCFEKLLPLVYVSGNCVVSHAEPLRYFSRREIIDASLKPEVIHGLTWTANGEAEEGSVEKIIKELIPSSDHNVFYFGGHRPVEGRYALRQDGRFIQIHNPLEQNIALVYQERDFDPDRNILSVEKFR